MHPAGAIFLDKVDFSIQKAHFGESVGLPAGGADAAPEPMSMGLLALGGMGVLLRCRHG